MNRGGPVAGALATLGAHSIRVTGALGATTAAAMVVASVWARHGLNVTDGSAIRGTITALLQFVGAHPAYPVAILVGLSLLVLGDDTPLLGN